MAFLAACTWFVAEFYGGRLGHFEPAVWQAISRLVFYLIVALLVGKVRDLTFNLDLLVKQRTAALESEIARRKELEKEASEIAEREQERISQELHDQLAGYLSGLAFRAASLVEALEKRGSPEVADAKRILTSVNVATDQVRNLARLLAPAQDNPDLRTALSRLVADVETTFEVTCLLEISDQLPTLSKDQNSQICRIVQEAVRNAIHHGHAQLIQVQVGSDGQNLNLSIRNDGQPWNVSTAQRGGLGIRIMHHRTEKLGGELSIQGLDEGGTLVTCTLPAAANSIHSSSNDNQSTEHTRERKDPCPDCR